VNRKKKEIEEEEMKRKTDVIEFKKLWQANQ
jgi:hypothetical protein